MAKFKDRIKFFLRIILYISIIFFIPIIITALYIIYNEGINSFQRGVSSFLLIILCTFLILIICSQLKYGLIFSLNKLKFPEELPQKIIEKFKKIKEKILTIKLDFLKNILEKSKKILNSVSDKIENLVDLLEDKINYPEEFEFKDRYDFSNIKNGLKKFIEISYKILMYLTIFSICCILIPMILITIYQFLIYFITLLATILEVLIAIIASL
ncbi:hypothetical protein HMPREF9942_00153 [Fusobacterium animalis F0419]|uniref:Uncharacterized protein n=1 Tax=Fusobacterium animalis F0419 TaxID=999414 RepID=H1HCF2_9FUSO|nr:hypothetical protein [Fusobacterium animalis]EHO79150.1 hypothetical protein HMPREF9942_00153 [Fusobacterium animalis F0419]